MTPATSFRTWFTRNSVNQIRGAHGTGKTTLLVDLGRHWDGAHHAWMFSLAPLSDQLSKTIVDGLALTVCSTLETLLENLRRLRAQGVGAHGLILIDDVPEWRSSNTARLAASARMWDKILTEFKLMECTAILAGKPKHQTAMKQHGSFGPKALDFQADKILDLEEIARNETGVIVEAIASKNRRDIAGPVGRLWIRPTHDPPVRTT